MRDFNRFLEFCNINKEEYAYLAFKGGFERVLECQKHNRDGHFIQLFYAIYDFFVINPNLITRVGIPAFEVQNDSVFLSVWQNFIHDKNNEAEGFYIDSLQKNLSPACGGYRQGGGGWSTPAKILFPTVAVYLSANPIK